MLRAPYLFIKSDINSLRDVILYRLSSVELKGIMTFYMLDSYRKTPHVTVSLIFVMAIVLVINLIMSKVWVFLYLDTPIVIGIS